MLLSRKPELSEKSDVLPFFKNHKHLSALIGCHHSRILYPDRIAYEFSLFGDFIADLVVGDSRTRSFCFVEFEDGRSESVFVDRGRSIREWSARFDHGFSQLVDWFCKLADVEKTDGFEAVFGSRTMDAMGMLVIGRSHALSTGDRARLEWRERHVLVNNNRIYCRTFDDLLDDLKFRLEAYSAAAQVARGSRSSRRAYRTNRSKQSVLAAKGA